MKRERAVDLLTDSDKYIGLTKQSYMQITSATQNNTPNAHPKLTKMNTGRRESKNEVNDAIHINLHNTVSLSRNDIVNTGLEPIENTCQNRQNVVTEEERRVYIEDSNDESKYCDGKREDGTHTQDSSKELNKSLRSDSYRVIK